MRVERAGDRSTASICDDIGAGNVQVAEPVAIATNLKEKMSERDGVICTSYYRHGYAKQGLYSPRQWRVEWRALAVGRVGSSCFRCCQRR